MNELYPLELALWQVPQVSPLNYEYISNIIANGLVRDFFVPGLAASNPILSEVDTFNQNIGILQTATNGINKILQYIDTLKKLDPSEIDLISNLSKDINDTINNTTFNEIPVFKDTIQLNGQNIDLTIPTFDINTTDIEEYEKLLRDKQADLYKILQDTTINFSLFNNQNEINPFDMETFESIINSGNLVNAYNMNLINPFSAFELLFY